MIIELSFINGKRMKVQRLEEFNLTQTAGVACDSLWAYFYVDKELEEISGVKAFKNDRLIFNGYCDCQRESWDEKGYKVFFYARSSASVLVDNEAMPLTYNKPSANQLFFSIAKDMGFSANLPRISSNTKYEVTKGMSCFGAINQFVLLMSGKSIYVTPYNEIRLLDYSKNVVSLDSNAVLYAQHTTNRSEPYQQIAFKKSNSQPDYSVHTKSRYGQELGINKSMLINLSSLPQWQRENTVLNKLKQSYENYKVLELKLAGYVDEGLLQRFRYKGYYDYALSEKRYFCNGDGEFTSLTLKKMIDIKEITYVD